MKCAGVNDLFGPLPDLSEISANCPLVAAGTSGVPDHHRLVHPAPIEVGAYRSLEVVDEGMHLLIRRRPIELALAVLDVPIERCKGRIDQFGHVKCTPCLSRDNHPHRRCVPITKVSRRWAGELRVMTGTRPVPRPLVSMSLNHNSAKSNLATVV